MNAPCRSIWMASEPFSGRFDAGCFDPHPLRHHREGPIDLPGLRLQASSAAHARNARFVVACAGRPRFHDAHARREAHARGDAAGWLALAARHGAQCVSHAGGEFALVLVDIDQQTLTLATDRFNQHPVFYRIEAGAIHFAQSPAALSATLAGQAIFDYFHAHVIGAPDTVYEGVMQLPAATQLRASKSGIEVAPHWTPRFECLHRSATRSLAAEFRNRVREAVSRSMEGTRTGCFLSGGTDSSTVAGMLSKITGARVPTYSIGFDAAGYDEMEYAQLAASHFDCAHHAHYMQPAELITLIPRLAAATDQPFGNSSLAPTFMCAQLARNHGTEHLLAGDGGDELFGGNTRYAEQLRLSSWGRLPAAARRSIEAGVRHAPDTALTRRAARFLDHVNTPLPDRFARHNLMRYLGVSRIFTPDFLGGIDTDHPLARSRRVWAQQRQKTLIDSMLAYDWQVTLADNDLPKVRQAAALAHIGVGFPLLDDRLVDFSLALAPALKTRGMHLRVFFKYALADFLPKKILRKKKHGFGLPFGPWLTTHPALNDFAREAIEALAARGVWRREFVDEISAALPAHPGYYGEMVWLGVMLEHWLRAHAPQWRL